MRLALVLLLCGCAGIASKKQKAPERMGDIARDYWDLRLVQSPRMATQLGDHRFDGDLEWASPPARVRERGELVAILNRIGALSELSEAERLDRDVLSRSLAREIAVSDACRYHLWHLDHLYGLQAQLAEIATYQSAETAEQALLLFQRYEQVPRLVADHVENLRTGALLDWTAPELSAKRVIAQIDAFDRSTFLPAKVHEGSRASLEKVIDERVLPALRRYRQVIAEVILPRARKSVALADLPFGAECYAREIEHHTGLRAQPQEIHELGLAEVARIRGEMDALIRKTKKPLAQLEKDPKQHVKTREALLAYVQAIVDRAQAALPKAFSTLPMTPLQLKPLEPYREKESPAAYYSSAARDGSRAGIYFLNTYAVEQRALYDQEYLAFHEAVPGHHLQIALAQELCCVAEFRRNEGQTAFVEGWALYAENHVAKELGLYSSDADELGRLGAELWRAKRLVVDTGMHALGWSREKALAFMKDGSTHPEVEMVNEIDRYITWPGQALAYKIGEIELRKLRKKSEHTLGSKFDVRAFHDVVLGAGALPLDLVRVRVERWLQHLTGG